VQLRLSLDPNGLEGWNLHPGRKREIEEVLEFYISSATKARAGSLRNGSPALEGIFLGEDDVDPLAAFLRALNEDDN
jgi:hypothetical protein